MTPINNSDLAWLITADYNQDNNIGFPDELREDINDPDVNDWEHDYADYGNKRVGDYNRNVGNNVDAACILEAEQGIVGHSSEYQSMSWEVGGISCVGSMGTEVGGNYDAN